MRLQMRVARFYVQELTVMAFDSNIRSICPATLTKSFTCLSLFVKAGQNPFPTFSFD